MPTNLVKTKHDEVLWNIAKELAKEEGHEEDWDYIVSIYLNLKRHGF